MIWMPLENDWKAWPGCLNNSIPIPGLNMRIGLDAIVGLVPGIGDLISAGVSIYLMSEASKLGVIASDPSTHGWKCAD